MFERRFDRPPRGKGCLNPDALLGMTRKKAKRRKMSSTKGNAQGRTSTVSFCPFCPITNMADPEQASRVTNPSSKFATCPKDKSHRWQVGSMSLSEPRKLES